MFQGIVERTTKELTSLGPINEDDHASAHGVADGKSVSLAFRFFHRSWVRISLCTPWECVPCNSSSRTLLVDATSPSVQGLFGSQTLKI